MAPKYAFFDELVSYLDSGQRIVGRGRSTQEAAERLVRGVPWDETGTPPPSVGNGSAMRTGPIGLLFFDDPEGMIQAAHDQGRITHRDPRCSAGAVALRGEQIDASRFLAQLTGWAGQMDEVNHRPPNLPRWLWWSRLGHWLTWRRGAQQLNRNLFCLSSTAYLVRILEQFVERCFVEPKLIQVVETAH